MKTLDREKKFLEKAKIVHSDKYDYSLVKYINAHVKVKIICLTHGVFEQEPDSHVRNHGCKNCNGGTKSNTSEFIKKSKNIHGDKYDYSLVNYITNRTKVKIICKKHGEFEQSPSDHLLGYDCYQCGKNKSSKSKTLTLNDFIKKAMKIHGNKYDYSKVNYRGHKYKIDIKCSKHGIFTQNTNSHLSGTGCPVCTESTGESKIRVFLENNNITFETQKRFKDCRNIRPLPFDFYLPKHNICIEYDGEQHFRLNRFHKNLENFNESKKKDIIKTNYCSGENGKPKLIRINYKQFNKVEELLNKKLTTK